MNPIPPNSWRNYLFPSVFIPRKKDDKAPITASLFFTLVSLTYWWLRFKAPILDVIFYTSTLFWLVKENIPHASLRTSSWGLLNIMSMIVYMPPLKHMLRAFLTWSSISSRSSSSSSNNFDFSIPMCPFSSVAIYFSLSTSLNVYYFMASSSHFRSSALIALNSDGLVPSWCCIDHLNNPFQSTI